MIKDIEKILVSKEEIENIVTRIASEIDRDYKGSERKLLLLCILKGSVVFMGELYNIENIDHMNFRKRSLKFTCRKERR